MNSLFKDELTQFKANISAIIIRNPNTNLRLILIRLDMFLYALRELPYKS